MLLVKNGKKVILETSWDDGEPQDYRLSQLLERHHLPATFYLPGYCTLDGDFIRELDDKFEVGSHTFSHPMDMKLVPNQYLEIMEGKRWLENIVGHEVRKFCYPRGRFNDETKKALRRAGVVQARTTRIGVTQTPRNPYERDTTVHVFNRPEYEGVHWLDYARQKLKEVKENGGYYHVWGHSWEIDKHADWSRLKELFHDMQKAFDL